MTERAVWGDFEVDFDALLGRGGMGAVYRGRQISLDRPVAIKVLDTAGAATEELGQAFLQKFEIESRALAKVHDSRIITVFQAGKNDGRCWYAMELIHGETVEDRLGKKGMFAETDAARIGLDVARALDAACRAGIVHRDVKPANIFLLDDGGTKLGDFGIARAADAPPTPMTQANMVVGTPPYISPEQGMGDPCDFRGDIYSLGVVLYEMLTERPPFSGASAMETIFQHCNQPPQSPRLLNPKISASMEAVILRCLAKSPNDRYQTYAELIDALDAAAAPAIPRRGGMWIALAVAAVVVAAVALAWPRKRPVDRVVEVPKIVRVEIPAPQPEVPPRKIEPIEVAVPKPVELEIPQPRVMPYATEPEEAPQGPGREEALLGQILNRAAHDDPMDVLAALQEAIAQAKEPLPCVADIIQAVCLRATDELERGRLEVAKQVLAKIERFGDTAAKSKESLAHELAAAEALAAKDFGAVLGRYERSRAYGKAAAQVLADFRKRRLSNMVAGAQWFQWEPSATGAAYHDKKTNAFVVKSEGGKQQAISRTFERAAEGFAVSLAFESAPNAWAVAFSRTGDTRVQIGWARDRLALRRVHDSDSSKDTLLSALDLADHPRSFSVAVVPVGELALVYLGDRLAFKVAAPVSNTIEIGVAGGRIDIAAVETTDEVEK